MTHKNAMKIRAVRLKRLIPCSNAAKSRRRENLGLIAAMLTRLPAAVFIPRRLHQHRAWANENLVEAAATPPRPLCPLWLILPANILLLAAQGFAQKVRFAHKVGRLHKKSGRTKKPATRAG